MRGGQMRHRVTLQTPPDPAALVDQDTFGQVLNTDPTKWTTVGTYWAFVRPLNAREVGIATEERGDVTHEVKMRYVGAINPKQQLIFQGTRTLNIEQVLNVNERNKEYTLICKEVVTP